ncbi:MAG: ATP-binding protein [Candidatus Omnitrophota bacterium]
MGLTLDLIAQWSQSNLDIIFFIYGLAFVGMGIAVFAQPKKGSKFKLAEILWLLAGFGLIHGVNEFLDMWAIIKGKNPVFDLVRSFILIISYLFLFEFSRRLFRICGQRYFEKTARAFGWWLTLIISFVILTLSFINSGDFWRMGTIFSRYLLGFPGCFLIGFSLIAYYKCKEEELAPLKVKKYFFGASLAFFTYGILGGLVVPRADFFPANLLNTDSFFSLMHVPVQAFRSICAIIIAWSICGVLRIFSRETMEKLQKEVCERKCAEDALQRVNNDLEARIQERTRELRNAYDELKVTQYQLIQSTKMASVGQLAGGIAHEINNPLTGILNNVQLIKMEAVIKKDFSFENFMHILDVVEESALRCKSITDSLLGFSRSATGKFIPVPVDELIRKVMAIISYEMKLQEINLKTEIQAGLPKVFGEPQLLQQVIFDLINNARWAIEKKPAHDGHGVITIRASLDPSEKRVLISVADTGIGISPEHLKKLFDPFFTTKPTGEGTGLGLSIIYNIVKQHSGDISVESTLGEGAVFTVSLPIAEKIAA